MCAPGTSSAHGVISTALIGLEYWMRNGCYIYMQIPEEVYGIHIRLSVHMTATGLVDCYIVCMVDEGFFLIPVFLNADTWLNICRDVTFITITWHCSIIIAVLHMKRGSGLNNRARALLYSDDAIMTSLPTLIIVTAGLTCLLAIFQRQSLAGTKVDGDAGTQV